MPMLSDIQSKIAAEEEASALRMAQLDPGMVPAYYAARSGQDIARGVGQLFGYEDPRIAEARQMEEAVSGVDLRNPQSLFDLSSKFLQMGDYDRAQKFYELGVTQEYYTGKNLASLLGGKKGSDIGQMSEATRTSIEKQLREKFRTTFDFRETNPENLPGGLSESAAIDEIFAIHQAENISIPDAIKAFTEEYSKAAGISPKTSTGKAPVYRPE
jgi:hypothetical protein